MMMLLDRNVMCVKSAGSSSVDIPPNPELECECGGLITGVALGSVRNTKNMIKLTVKKNKTKNR